MDDWTSSAIAGSQLVSEQVANEVAYNHVVENYLRSPEGQMAAIANQLQMYYRDYDNAWSARQAEIQRSWSAEEAEKNRIFNMQEAEKNRQWQQYMSSSAHTREVQDLLNAGLNPVLSVMGGNGASVGSGATAASAGNPSGSSANGNQSAGMALASILSTVLSNQQKMTETMINADLVREQNGLAREQNEMLTLLGYEYGHRNAILSADATMNAAFANASAMKYSANMQYETQKLVQEHTDARQEIQNAFDAEQAQLEREHKTQLQGTALWYQGIWNQLSVDTQLKIAILGNNSREKIQQMINDSNMSIAEKKIYSDQLIAEWNNQMKYDTSEFQSFMGATGMALASALANGLIMF